MTRRVRGALAVAATLTGLALAAAVLHARETRYATTPDTERLLYLRSGTAADRLMLSFDALAADFYWIRTIQHYGRDRKSRRAAGRFELLQPLLDLTTTLDPKFLIAYRFGAVFLAMPPPDGPGLSDQAIGLLEKGMASNPDRWHLPHDIGFIHYWHTGDYTAAASWFERAAALPNAPAWLGPLAATTRLQGGSREGARRIFTELLASEEQYIRQAAERGLMQLQALGAIDELNALIEKFHAIRGRYPSSWAELLGATPYDAARLPFIYDPVAHRATLSPDSPLAPLPHTIK